MLYTAVLYLAMPLVAARLLWRARHEPAYRRRWPERFGFVARPPAGRRIWLHAVSVGEVRAAEALVQALLAQSPGCAIHLSTVTPGGAEMARRLFGEQVTHSYLPYDLPGAVGRFLDRLGPALALVMETEVWPNLFAACTTRGIPLCLLNARVSDRSFARYRRARRLLAHVLQQPCLIAAQSEADRQRFMALGAVPARLVCSGNLKFDMPLPDAPPPAQDRYGGGRPVWVAGSTHAGEEALVLDAFQALRAVLPDTLLVLVPRHPPRAAAVAGLCRQRGLITCLLSEGGALGDGAQVLVGDTLGDLRRLYAGADVAFVGGSLVAHGGHNPLEPAAAGVAVVSGRHTANFGDIYRSLTQAGAAVEVGDAAELAARVKDWLMDDSARRRAGAAGRRVVEANRGALEHTLAALRRGGWIG